MRHPGLVAGITSFLNMLSAQFINDSDPFYEYEHKDACIKELESRGFKVIGAGSFRIAVVHRMCPKLVFKVPYMFLDLGDVWNMAREEFEFYEKATELQKKYLAKCLWYDELVCVMEKVEGYPSGMEYVKFYEQIYLNCAHYEEFNDVSSRNVLKTPKGDFILIDYTKL